MSPSVTVTSLIDERRRRRRRRSCRGPARPERRRSTGLGEVDEERLVGLVEQVAVHRHGDRSCVVWPGAKVSVPLGRGVVAGGGGRAVRGRVVDASPSTGSPRESVTVKVALVVPALPSVTVTSSIEIAGGASSSVIVPSTLAVGDRGVAGFDRLTKNVSFDLVEQVAAHEDVERLGRLARREGQRAARRRVVAQARSRCRRRSRSRRSPSRPLGGDEADGEERVDRARVALGQRRRR